jgi:hypothetical protein
MMKNSRKHRIDPGHYVRIERDGAGWYRYEVWQLPEFGGRAVFSGRCRATRIADVVAHATEALAKRSSAAKDAKGAKVAATVDGATAPVATAPGATAPGATAPGDDRRVLTIVIDELRCGHVVTLEQLHALVLTRDPNITIDQLRQALQQLLLLRIVVLDADDVGTPLRYQWWRSGDVAG